MNILEMIQRLRAVWEQNEMPGCAVVVVNESNRVRAEEELGLKDTKGRLSYLGTQIVFVDSEGVET